MFQIKSYLKFLLNSTNEHGIHSPFVFDLVTKCFYDRKNYPEYKILKRYKNSLLRNTMVIDVKDFGAGSKVFKSNKRQVCKIAKNAGINSNRAELLFRMIKYFNFPNMLEIGTSLGLATSALSLGNPKASITTIEGCPETSGLAKKEFSKFHLDNIECVIIEFRKFLSGTHGKKYDLIYFDGNHTKEATLSYFKLLLPTVNNSSVWIFDDIHWSAEMEEVWNDIKKHPEVTVTIDTFQWGIVFFRKEQVKENFIIRS